MLNSCPLLLSRSLTFIFMHNFHIFLYINQLVHLLFPKFYYYSTFLLTDFIFHSVVPVANMPRISPEKSTFAQTCNLLSHYIKEKGTLRDLNLGINEEAADTGFSGKPMNLFPQHASMQDDAISITTSSEQGESEPKNGQMTIFYAGQVLVFDDISAVKAQQVMQLASKSVSPVNTSTGFVIPASSSTSKLVENQGNYSMSSASGSVQSHNGIKQQWQPIVSDMPIARRASLHRFLSKRKGRPSARGPYHLHCPSAESTKQQFDLNL